MDLSVFKYYQTIDYTPCDLDIFQQDVVVHRCDGTPFEETSGGYKVWHIYVGDRCQENYGDIRFTDGVGHELSYYLWPDFTSEVARFGVRLEHATSNGTIVIWYGNSDITTTSNGDATYFLHDHFDTFRTNVWDYLGSPSVVSGELRLYSITSIRTKQAIPSKNVRLETKSKFSSAYRFRQGIDGYRFELDYPPVQSSSNYDWYLGSSAIWYKTPYPPVGIWCTFWVIYTSNSAIGGWDSNSIIECSTVPPESGIMSMEHWNADTHIVDYILVRAYSSSPPLAITFSGECQSMYRRGFNVSFGSASMMIV